MNLVLEPVAESPRLKLAERVELSAAFDAHAPGVAKTVETSDDAAMATGDLLRILLEHAEVLSMVAMAIVTYLLKRRGTLVAKNGDREITLTGEMARDPEIVKQALSDLLKDDE